MHKRFMSLLCLFTSITCLAASDQRTLQVAVLGLGGRAQDILYNCLKEAGQDCAIKVVAICDDHAQASFDAYLEALLKRRAHESEEIKQRFNLMMKDAHYYPDTPEGIQQLFEQHPTIDRVIIASSNDRHLPHLMQTLQLSDCKHIFLEKPIFRNLEEFTQFNTDIHDRSLYIGLVLRYAPMAKIAADLLAQHKAELGQLQQVRSWEHVNFAHALTIIMMNWRRFKDQSGGLLLEKSVHDLDLALFFMQAVDEVPHTLHVTTETSHEFFKKSRHQEILSALLQNKELREKADFWEHVAFQRTIPFCHDEKGSVDWKATLDAFFKDFPEDDALPTSNIIPDRHTVRASMQTTKGSTIDFELHVRLNNFAKTTERGTHFIFEHGNIIIDIEEGNMKIINNRTQQTEEVDLKVNKASHGGGDRYVAQTILGTLPEGNTKTMFHDPAVQLSTVLGLVSEHQAVHPGIQETMITAMNGQWHIQHVRDDA